MAVSEHHGKRVRAVHRRCRVRWATAEPSARSTRSKVQLHSWRAVFQNHYPKELNITPSNAHDNGKKSIVSEEGKPVESISGKRADLEPKVTVCGCRIPAGLRAQRDVGVAAKLLPPACCRRNVEVADSGAAFSSAGRSLGRGAQVSSLTISKKACWWCRDRHSLTVARGRRDQACRRPLPADAGDADGPGRSRPSTFDFNPTKASADGQA